MPRNISTSMMTAIQSNVLRPAVLVEATFTTGPVYLWSGTYPLTWNSQTWLGVGSFGTVSNIEEVSAVEAKGMTIGLSGFDPDMLTDVLYEFQIATPVTTYFALFDGSGNLIPDPLIAFRGRMDQPSVSIGGDTASISINCESRLLDMNVAAERRYTDADTQQLNKGDLGCAFVSAISSLTLYWGRHPTATNNFSGQGYSS